MKTPIELFAFSPEERSYLLLVCSPLSALILFLKNRLMRHTSKKHFVYKGANWGISRTLMTVKVSNDKKIGETKQVRVSLYGYLLHIFEHFNELLTKHLEIYQLYSCQNRMMVNFQLTKFCVTLEMYLISSKSNVFRNKNCFNRLKKL